MKILRVVCVCCLVVVGVDRSQVAVSAFNHRHVLGVLPAFLGETHGDAHAQEEECNPARKNRSNKTDKQIIMNRGESNDFKK